MAVRIPPKRNVRRATPEIRVVNPGKGLSTLVSDSHIKDEEASDLSNVMFVEDGAVSKRYGHTQVGTTLSNNPKGLGVIYTSSVRQVVTIDGTSLVYLNGSTWTTVSGKTFTTGKETNFTQARGALYIWNGTDGGGKYDGTTLSTPGTMPSALFSIFFSGYHVAAGTATQQNRLYVSVLLDASDFTNDPSVTDPTPDNSTDVPGATTFAGTGTGSAIAQFVDVSKDDGDKITGLAKFGSALVIFKERSAYQMVIDSSGVPTITQIPGSVGCVSHKSIDNVENDVFFLSRGGYYVLGNEPNYFNVIRTNELSQRVHPTIEGITAANLPRAASMYFNFVFYGAIPYGGTTTNNRILTYDRRYLGWGLNTSVNVNAFTEFIDSSNVRHLYYASDDDTKIFEIDTSYQDDGAAISAYWVSKFFDAAKPEIKKHWQFVDVTLRQVTGSVSLTLYLDNDAVAVDTTISNATDITGTMGSDLIGLYYIGGVANANATVNTAANTRNIVYRIPINRDSKGIKLKISNANINETFTLLGFTFRFRLYSPYNFDSSNILQNGINPQPTPVPSGAIVTEDGAIIVTE